MPVRQLPENVVNRIAAGEVIERPASVVKELVENAIDAGATRIEVVISGGGRELIRVSDDGGGMSADDLALSVERHATSKLDSEDLLNISTLGFRGEALPSIGAAARLSITTRREGQRKCARDPCGRRGKVRNSARRTERGHARRSARSFLRDARAPEIPEKRTGRNRSRDRCDPQACAGASGCRLHDRGRRARDSISAARCRRSGPSPRGLPM